ncbi:MAG: hypothetical protein OEZ35_00375 [Candidatus Bathyarchaeota archaeon]|nr:hypothetical protein [Candidatus Bathyarchaeota archaeon]
MIFASVGNGIGVLVARVSLARKGAIAIVTIDRTTRAARMSSVKTPF